MKLEITQEMKEAFNAYKKAEKAHTNSDNYDGRSAESKALRASEKFLRQLISDEAHKTIEKIAVENNCAPVRYNTKINVDNGFSYHENTFEPKVYLGSYGEYAETKEQITEYLKKSKTEYDQHKENKKIANNTIRETAALLKAHNTEMKFEDRGENEWVSNKIYFNKEQNNSHNTLNMEISNQTEKPVLVGMYFQCYLQDIPKEKAIEIFETIQKLFAGVVE